jgi:predicted amidohydrolase YtcJ
MTTFVIKAIGVIDHNGDLVGDTIIVDKNMVERVGSGLQRSYAKTVSVDGYVTPSFVDAHLHIAGLGLSLSGVDLKGTRSVRELVERLAKSSLSIVFGRGWDQEEFEERRYPTRQEIDAAVPDRPAVAVRTCGHVAVVNTVALEVTKPWERYPDLVDRERGLVFEDAVGYVVERLMSNVDLTPLVKKALTELRKAGLGGVSSMSCSLNEFKALLDLEKDGEVPLFVACYSPPDEAEKIIESFSDVASRKVSLTGIKLFADGSLGARTAYLREPYSDMKETRGKLLLSSKKIVEISKRYLSLGLRVATHAIGDAALDEVLEAYEALNIGDRGRIEHASITWDEQIKKLADLGVYAVVQPHFRVSDWWIDRRLGSRYLQAYRFRSLVAAGVPVALSTDSPVEPFDPVETFAAAVGRCDSPSCREEESLDPKDVIRGYTTIASRASGGPVKEVGTLEKGSYAMLSWTPNDPRDRAWEGPLRPLELS